MKKILALAMVLGVIGSVVGCGSKTEDTTTPAATAGGTAGAATAGSTAETK